MYLTLTVTFLLSRRFKHDDHFRVYGAEIRN